MADTKTYTVERTGRRPLRFKGERIASSDNSSDNADRWTEARVFRRPAFPNHEWADHDPPRGYVLAVSHFTRWDGESDRHDAFVCDTLGELAANIEELPAAVADELLEALGIVEDLDAAAGGGS